MKATLILALLGTSSAIALRGIPDGSLMDKNPSYWRKIWPEGDTDDGLEDAKTLNAFLAKPAPAPPRAEHDWIPYEPHTTTMEN